MVLKDLFFLQNNRAGYCGNSPLWWADPSGHTTKLCEAKRFTSEEADGIIEATRSSHSWTKWPVREVMIAGHWAVDIQDLRPREKHNV